MSQRINIQRNHYRGDFHNFGGALVAGGVFNAENIFIGSQPVDGVRNGGPDLLEKEGLCVLSLGMFTHLVLQH
jgi:hypothetical protein